MGGSKIFPEVVFGAKMPQKELWSPMIEKLEDQAARNAQVRISRDSFHAIPSITYPPSPFKYRTRLYSFDPDNIQPRIVEQPDIASLQKPCPYRKKLEKDKSEDTKKRSEFLLSKFVRSAAAVKKKEIYIWNENVKPERLRVLIKSLASPLELEQLYAAQALGHLGIAEESVISALYNTLQNSDNIRLQYEAARSLALLGCLDTCVMKVLIRHLKVASLNRREDTLAALKVALQAWSIIPSFEWYCIGARHSLIRNLQRLVNLQEPLDNITFDAAICLGYLDKSNPIAQDAMLTCLVSTDWKRKFQALVMLIKHMGVMNAIIIRNVLDQLECSPVYKHRADATRLLTIIGLEIIQQEGLEEDVFNVLLKKVSDEPFLMVRQNVALAIEELQMKKQAWEIIEKHLKEEDEVIRMQAVIALGVLGIRQKNVFFALLEMLDLDTSEDVRVQVIRAFATLGLDNMYVRKSLTNKKQEDGILARESSKALKMLDENAKVRKEFVLQTYSIP